MTSESDLLRHIAARSGDISRTFPHVVIGPGDDCAVVRSPVANADLLLTVDQLVEHRHFLTTTGVNLIARKAVARSVSDIAAMGGVPIWGLATGLLPPGYPHAQDLFDALARWARHFNAPLVGGDIATASPQPSGAPLSLTLTIAGTPTLPRGPVLRSTAQPGDELWVTGKLGNSFLSGRHLTFEPRLREGAWLAQHLGHDLHAMIDLSDGLGRDTGRIATASGVRIEIDAAALPLHSDVVDPVQALADGEDYELCFTTAPRALDRHPHPADLAPFTRMGRVLAGSGCVYFPPAGGPPQEASVLGWDHMT